MTAQREPDEPARWSAPEGTCPSCREASHPGTTCRGESTEDVLERLLSKPERKP